jgi:regulator of protease activity HflC (stomatin/prohibitin superfamily)
MGGIGSILGVLALIGFVIFLAGIGTVVLASSQGRSPRSGVVLAIVGLVVGALFSIIGNGLLFVDVTQAAVITNTLTGNLEQPRRAGTSIIIPGLQLPTFYPINQQNYTMSSVGDEGQRRGDDAVDATTVDGQPVSLDVTIFYSIDPAPDALNRFHTRWGQNWEGFIRSTARTVVRDVVSTFRAEQIYGEGRVQMQLRINDQMRTRMETEGMILNSVDVRGLRFSDTFIQAIEAAAAAEQAAVRARFEVEQRRQEADQARARAQGERDAAIARAEGDAQATILQAQAEAEALRLVSEQIAANPSLIQYLYVQNLSDNVSIALVPSNSPFLFSLDSLANPSTITAPDIPGALPTPGS